MFDTLTCNDEGDNLCRTGLEMTNRLKWGWPPEVRIKSLTITKLKVIWTAVAPALTSLLAIVERAANALSKLMSSVLATFGIKTDFSKSFKGTDTATQTMADNTSETADNIDDATDSQKKFNKAQQGALAGYLFHFAQHKSL